MTGAMAQTKLNIVLCGFMGCGKSTVGKKLSQMTQMEFVDMDGYIEKRAGMKIPDIFEKHGEGFFRDLEHEPPWSFLSGAAMWWPPAAAPDLPAECGRVQGRRRDRTAGYSSAGASAAAEKTTGTGLCSSGRTVSGLSGSFTKADAPLSEGRRCSNSHERLS